MLRYKINVVIALFKKIKISIHTKIYAQFLLFYFLQMFRKIWRTVFEMISFLSWIFIT